MDKIAKCSACGKPACVTVCIVAQGQEWLVSLCPDHAQVFNEITRDLQEVKGMDHLTVKTPVPVYVCPKCGIRLSDIKKNGLFGCASCYEAFASELPAFLKLSQHYGKIPSKSVTPALLNTRINHWQTCMDEAVATEAYESAAEYRDRIKDLKTLFPKNSTPNAVSNN